MNNSHPGRRWTGAAAAALLLAATIAAPASARQDPGGPLLENTQQVSPQCQLRRIGAELVRCDSLTGGGVPAASWIPEL